MIYCTDVVTKGNPYKIYRNETLIEQYHGIVDEITDNLCVYIGFFGEADVKSAIS